jgi:HEAT repeat protein
MKSNRMISLIALLVIVLSVGAWARDTYVAPTTELTKEQKEMLVSLNSDKPQERAKAAEKLGVQCCKKAVDVLTTMMKTDDVNSLRIVAANALWKIGDKRAVDAMREQAKIDKSKTVRTALAAIADKLEKGEKAS